MQIWCTDAQTHWLSVTVTLLKACHREFLSASKRNVWRMVGEQGPLVSSNAAPLPHHTTLLQNLSIHIPLNNVWNASQFVLKISGWARRGLTAASISCFLSQEFDCYQHQWVHINTPVHKPRTYAYSCGSRVIKPSSITIWSNTSSAS